MFFLENREITQDKKSWHEWLTPRMWVNPDRRWNFLSRHWREKPIKNSQPRQNRHAVLDWRFNEFLVIVGFNIADLFHFATVVLRSICLCWSWSQNLRTGLSANFHFFRQGSIAALHYLQLAWIMKSQSASVEMERRGFLVTVMLEKSHMLVIFLWLPGEATFSRSKVPDSRCAISESGRSGGAFENCFFFLVLFWWNILLVQKLYALWAVGSVFTHDSQ